MGIGSLRKKSQRRLRVETLEQRNLLATITVNSLLDDFNPQNPTFQDGKITLREAIEAANTNSAVGDVPNLSFGDDTIEFAPSLNGGVIELDKGADFGELVIQDVAFHDLTIDANDLDLEVRPDNGKGEMRIFNVVHDSYSDAPLVTLDGLTISGGNAKGYSGEPPARNGGAIFSSGRLLVRNSTISNNEAESGGAIFSSPYRYGISDFLRIENSTVSSNEAATGGGVSIGGYSYYNDLTVSIKNTVITGNTADFNGGGVHAILANIDMSLENVTIESNVAGTETLGNGGGMRVELSAGASVILDHVSLDNNQAVGSGSSGGLGGGLSADVNGSAQSSSELRIESGSSFSLNTAQSGAGLHVRMNDNSKAEVAETIFDQNTASETSGRGGAIYADYAADAVAEFDLADSSLTGNTAYDGGGAFVGMDTEPLHGSSIGSEFEMRRTAVEENVAENRGGGVHADIGIGGQFSVQQSTLSGNAAGEDLSSYELGELPQSGGGLYAYVLSLDSSPGELNVRDSTFDNNVAGRHGGGIAICSKREDDTVVTDNSGARVGIVNTTVSGNRAGQTDTSFPYNGTGGGIHLAIFDLLNSEREALNVDIINSTIYDNTAGPVIEGTESHVGGGIYSLVPTVSGAGAGNRTNVKLRNTIVSGNHRHDGAANNFWGSINASESQHNLISYSQNASPPDNQFVDHISRNPITFANLGNGNNTNGGTNDPGLLPLGDYGGPTQTHELEPTSPALDNGDNALASEPFAAIDLDWDQRGVGSPRIDTVTGIVDIGAVEWEPLVPGTNWAKGPRVTKVTIGSSDPGIFHPDYEVPDELTTSIHHNEIINQISTVPVASPDQIIVEFSEPVSVVTNPTALMPFDLTVVGLRTLTSYPVESASVSGNEVTWTLADPVSKADQLEFTINQHILGSSGFGLNGDWTSPQTITSPNGSKFPSGDNFKLGDFVFHVTVQPGDFNQDNVVDVSDFNIWNGNKFTIGNTYYDGDANGNHVDGIVDTSDFNIWNNNKFTGWTGLPNGTGALTTVNVEEMRRMVDRIIERFGVLNDDGTLNTDASMDSWLGLTRALERLFSKFGVRDSQFWD